MLRASLFLLVSCEIAAGVMWLAGAPQIALALQFPALGALSVALAALQPD